MVLLLPPKSTWQVAGNITNSFKLMDSFSLCKYIPIFERTVYYDHNLFWSDLLQALGLSDKIYIMNRTLLALQESNNTQKHSLFTSNYIISD